jgi:UDP-N-acetylglucosamine acyltransferase
VKDETHGEIIVHAGAHVEQTAVLIGPCEIMPGAYVGHYCVIGSPAQHHGYYPDDLLNGKRDHQGVLIQQGAVVREHSQVQQGIKRKTEVRFDAMVMAGSHIAHDVLIGPDATIGSHATFGGFTEVLYAATLGQLVVTHPWTIIGQHSMIGQGSCVVKDVAPYQKVAGNPAKLLGKNTGAGGDKEEWDESTIDTEEMDVYRQALNTRNQSRSNK